MERIILSLATWWLTLKAIKISKESIMLFYAYRIGMSIKKQEYFKQRDNLINIYMIEIYSCNLSEIYLNDNDNSETLKEFFKKSADVDNILNQLKQIGINEEAADLIIRRRIKRYKKENKIDKKHIEALKEIIPEVFKYDR